MKLVWLPKDSAGKWSVVLSVLFVLLMWLKFFALVRLPLPSPAIALLSIAALILGLISIFLHRARAILLVIPMLLGLLVVVWTAGELIYPH